VNVETILLTAHDLRRLTDMVAWGGAWHGRDREHLETLAAKLDDAGVVSPEAIPRDVITIHSEVRVRHLDTGAEATYTLAYPGRREAVNAVSVLAPMGTALLGCREGDEVDWQAPGGHRRFKVLEVLYQPEAMASRLVAPEETGLQPVAAGPDEPGGASSGMNDPQAKRLVGNFPQALSHIGLINTARNLARHRGPAEDRSETHAGAGPTGEHRG
jgi:regulator of nucleoside diphosphate kinase